MESHLVHDQHVSYRIWEEFVQSIQMFLTDRKNLANASCGNKKTTHLLIQNVRFTKLIIHHLKTKHTIHLRIGATKSPKATKVTKPKADKATKPVGDKAPMLTSTQPPKPKLAPTQPSKAVPEKKGKLVKETPNEPSPRKRSKGGLVGKIRKPRSPVKLVDEPSAEDVPGLARPVVIREPDSRRIQPLPDVQGKGKEKVVDEQAAHDLLTLLTPNNKSHLALTDSEMEYDNAASNIDTGDQDESQAGPNPGVQDEGQKMDEEFTTTAYPNVQDNLKLPFEDLVIPEEPASSTGTLFSLQNLKKELSFTDQFFMEKQQDEEPGTNTKVEVQSMVSVPIYQDTFLVPPMTTLVIDLTTSQLGSPLLTSITTTSMITTTTSLPPPPQQSITYPSFLKRIDAL
uniref:Uncharacterized protein n=1 Tax=Tanacetum cinerariifolium TaxID=118510 RepID=A0A6L2LY49_TANCI|nr:hypothetical protein [Tanacetum cinerariifolium]